MRILPLVAFAVAAAQLPAQWALMSPASSPSARRAGAAAFDAAGNRLRFVGGIQPSPSTILGQTWSWNGTVWTQLSPAGGTIPRWGHGLVRNTQNNRLITFGGRSPTLSAYASDTQEWTGTAWQTIVTANAPSARHLYGFAYDGARNRAVLGVTEQDGALIVRARTSTNRNNSNITLVFSAPAIELRQWTVKDNQGGTTTVALQGTQTGGSFDQALFAVPAKAVKIKQSSR